MSRDRQIIAVGLIFLLGCTANEPASVPSTGPGSKAPGHRIETSPEPAWESDSSDSKTSGNTPTVTSAPPMPELTTQDSKSTELTTSPPRLPTPSVRKVAESPAASAVPSLEKPAADGHNWLTREELEAGWVRLFDGQTLFGWKANSDLNWTVTDGVISADEGKPGLLCTTSRFADYELRCDYKLAAGGNSGIFLRTPQKPADPAVDCYELNMCDTHPAFGTGSLVKRAKTEMAVTGDGEWHSFHVRVAGPQVTVQFDGKVVLDYTDTTEKPLTTGHIGLQMNGGKIEFRNVYLKPLGTRPIFDGESLSGWREVPGSKSQFTVKDQTIHVKDGRGFLETELTAGNFVLQFEATTNGDKLNSGIFFRAMPGTEKAPSHGYEFQIQSGFKNDDRNQPDDHGTGAIFKRASARRVISSDRQWFTAMLVADGPHITTWIDGVQVVDWTDERPENDNPREGLRVKPGHFSLQGHDPTTDLAFRNLRLADTPE